MRFEHVRITGVSRLPGPAGWLMGRYEIHWRVEEPFFEGTILAETPDQVWPAISEAVRKWWAGRPLPDPMFELVGQERRLDIHDNPVEAGCV